MFDRPEMTTEARVSETGKIRFPLIGDIDVGGQSTAEVEKRIADLLISGNYLRKPQVSVIVLTYRSQQISVLGQVNRPGRYPLEQPSKLSDMLAMAGGIAPSGADTVKLVRYVDDGRFAADRARRHAPSGPDWPLDEDFLAALAFGMPPSAGIAMGFDRLAMIASGARRIDQVLWLIYA